MYKEYLESRIQKEEAEKNYRRNFDNLVNAYDAYAKKKATEENLMVVERNGKTFYKFRDGHFWFNFDQNIFDYNTGTLKDKLLKVTLEDERGVDPIDKNLYPQWYVSTIVRHPKTKAAPPKTSIGFDSTIDFKKSYLGLGMLKRPTDDEVVVYRQDFLKIQNFINNTTQEFIKII